MLCPSEFKKGFRQVVFAQSPSPDWAKQIFSANSASLRLLLNLFTAEAQRTPREDFFCLSGDDDKQKDSSEWEEGRKAYFLEESGFIDCRRGLPRIDTSAFYQLPCDKIRRTIKREYHSLSLSPRVYQNPPLSF